MRQMIQQTCPSRQIFDLSVKIAIFWALLLFFWVIPVMRYFPNSGVFREVMRDRNHPVKRRNAKKLTKKSKIFTKAKVIFMKSCLLGHVGFMI